MTKNPHDWPLDDPNPFASPETGFGPIDSVDPFAQDAERIRREHIDHEASIKTLGGLFYVSAFSNGLKFVSGLVSWQETGELPRGGLMMIVIPALLIVPYWLLGRGLRQLQGWARWPAAVIMVLVFLLVSGLAILMAILEQPMGLLLLCGVPLFLYILYLLLAPRASTIFSPEYVRIVDQTREIQPGTSTLARLVYGILGLIVAGAILIGLSQN